MFPTIYKITKWLLQLSLGRLVLVGLILFFGLLVWWLTLFPNDDAAISWRYARNLIDGHGLVYNASERVEGYSNFAWTLATAFGLLFIAPDAILYWTIFLSIVCGAGALLVLYRHTRRELGEQWWLLPTALLASCTAMAYWGASGLESVAVVFIQTGVWAMTCRVEKENDRTALLWLLAALVASILIRADGFLIPLLAVVYLAVKGRFRQAKYCFAVVLLTIGIYFSWRHAYYGWWLPNTAYAKVTGLLSDRLANAWGMFTGILMSTGIFIPIAALLAETLRSGMTAIKEKSLKPIPFHVVVFLAWMGYYFYVGGDIYYERFLLLLFPLGFFTLARLLKDISGGVAKDRFVLVAVGITLLILSFAPVGRYQFMKACSWNKWDETGKFIAAEYPGAKIAVDAAGLIAYNNPDSFVIDIYGLNDEHIGHLPYKGEFLIGHCKSDPPYVLAKKPDLICSWVGRDGGAMNMSPQALAKCGYRLRYVVDRELGVVDIQKLHPENVDSFWKGRGVSYGILVQETPPDSPIISASSIVPSGAPKSPVAGR